LIVSVLVTRPQPGAAETARRLIAMGRTPVLAPVLDIVPLAAGLPPPGQVQAVLATSANALAALRDHAALPLLTVGDATAAKARAFGFTEVRSAAGDARALAELAVRVCNPAGLPLLLASQQGQGQGLAQALREAGFAVVHRSVYAARPVGGLPEPARAALCGHAVEAALFFSTATAQVFVSLAASLPLETFTHVDSLAISSEAAAALVALPWHRIRIAAAPNQDELLGLLP
jgi:uroporphyrinogen-III synthase